MNLKLVSWLLSEQGHRQVACSKRLLVFEMKPLHPSSPFIHPLVLLQYGSCAAGDDCPFSHNTFEMSLHPERCVRWFVWLLASLQTPVAALTAEQRITAVAGSAT